MLRPGPKRGSFSKADSERILTTDTTDSRENRMRFRDGFLRRLVSLSAQIRAIRGQNLFHHSLLARMTFDHVPNVAILPNRLAMSLGFTREFALGMCILG